MSSRIDRLFAKPIRSVQDFVFDRSVASVFDNMISRSVPLYDDIQSACAKLAARLVQPGTKIYDLGCSSGTTLVLLAEALRDLDVEIVGIDSSEAMLEECRSKLVRCGCSDRVSLLKADVGDTALEAASVVVLNYTLQFLPVVRRPVVLRKIFDALVPSGALLMSEKVTHRSETLNRVLYEMHHDFKRQNGYSDLEISQKREALENVLIPLSSEENKQMLEQAGFREIEVFAKWYNFASFIAFRG